MMDEELDKIVLKKLGLELGDDPDLNTWKTFLTKLKNQKTLLKLDWLVSMLN